MSSPHSEAVFQNSYPPSSCTFRDDVAPFMKPLLTFFWQIGSPFYINAYPFLAYKSDSKEIDLNYAIFEHTKGIYDPKTKLHYDNMFDAMVDASYAALEKAGFPKVQVRILVIYLCLKSLECHNFMVLTLFHHYKYSSISKVNTLPYKT